jgi:GNAT superfamily N-acetyltransferase
MSQSAIAGAILADAFLHYPLMLYAFNEQTEAQRKKRLLHLYNGCANACNKFGGVHVSNNQKAAVVWLSGKNFPLGLIREIQSGMIAMPIKIGIKSLLRLINHDAISEGWIRKNAGEEMGYIWCIGVDASERGKGYSRIMIEHSITAMKAQGLNEFWLKTEDPKNVAIYLKLGFDLVHEILVENSGIKTWIFRKAE